MDFTNLVIARNGEPLTTSLIVADAIGVQHKNTLELIKKYDGELQQLHPLAFETRKGKPLLQGGFAKETIYALLNEQQATFLISLSRNTPRVVEFKLALVKAFYLMKEALRRQNEKLISDIEPQEVRWYKPSRKTYFSKAVKDFLKARPLTPKEFELFMDALRTAMDEGQENVLMANQDNRMILDDATTNKLLTYLKWLNSNENKFKSLASRMRHLAVELSDAASDLNLYSEGFGITRGILTGRIEDTVKRLKRNN